jgi:archaeal flagellin FlaB
MVFNCMRMEGKMIDNKRAEMGVGTLIIFIAMLLVAAVAAGVLIQTISTLQEKSLTTGDQATTQISTNAQTIEVSATNGQDGKLNHFQQLVKLSPGSDPIKIEQIIFTFNTKNETSTLKYEGDFECTNTTLAGDGYYTNVTGDGTGVFSVVYEQTGSNWVNGNLQRGDLVRMCYEAPGDITEDEEVRLNFIPKIGTATLTQFVTPDVISTERVYLYP